MGKIIVYLTTGTAQTLPNGWVIGAIVSSLVVALAIYLLRSIGVYTLAKRNGAKGAWMAWLPGLWIYPVCMLIGEYRFFGRTYKSLAVIFTVLITALEVITLVYDFIAYFPLVGYYFSGGLVYVGEGADVLANNIIEYWTGNVYVTNAIRYPYQRIGVLIIVLRAFNLIASFLDFAEVIIIINAYIALFRKFWPRHYIVAAVMSFFGLFPFFIFAIRKNRPMDYASYMHKRYQNYYNDYGSSNANQRSPFDEYPNDDRRKNEDPFEEFSDKNR